MPTGIVNWFDTTWGFGFVAADDSDNDVFVHINAIARACMTGLANNMTVACEMCEGWEGHSSTSEMTSI